MADEKIASVVKAGLLPNDRAIIRHALDTQAAVYRRAINSSRIPGMKELVQDSLDKLLELKTRI